MQAKRIHMQRSTCSLNTVLRSCTYLIVCSLSQKKNTHTPVCCGHFDVKNQKNQNRWVSIFTSKERERERDLDKCYSFPLYQSMHSFCQVQFLRQNNQVIFWTRDCVFEEGSHETHSLPNCTGPSKPHMNFVQLSVGSRTINKLEDKNILSLK